MNKTFKRLLAGAVLAVAGASAWGTDGQSVRFDVTRFDIVGNTLLPASEVDAVLRNYLGPGRDVASVQQARRALEDLFHARGYSLVSVRLPQQQVDDGVVRLQVVQPVIGRVDVIDNAHFSQANVRHSIPALQEGAAPDTRAIAANLKQANENPARQLTLKLASSAAVEDQVDATVEVRDETPWKLIGSVANTGSDATGKTQVGVALQHANLFGLDHVATLQYITSAESPGRVKVYGAGYHIPFYTLGDSLDLYASYSNVDAGTLSAGAFNLAVSGKGAVYGARYNQALLRRGSVESSLAYGMEIKSYRNSVQLEGIELGNNVTVRPLSLSYQASAPMTRGQWRSQLALVRNLPGGPNGDQRAVALVRSNARADYTLLRLSASATRIIAQDWQLRAIVNGQYTRDALVPGEQFGAGGASSVRGFLEREFANDVGATLNLEAYTPNLCQRDGLSCRLLSFYDTAHLRRNEALPGELDRITIASAGLGVRLTMSTRASLQLDWGHVTRPGPSARADANRLHLRLALAY